MSHEYNFWVYIVRTAIIQFSTLA